MNPLLQKRIRRFRRNKRGWYSFWIVSIAFLLSLFSNVLCNPKPLILSYEGSWYFPIFKFYPASQFGQEVAMQPDYKQLTNSQAFQASDNWAIYPIIPFGENDSDRTLGEPPPTAPSKVHWLGTDDRGRDLAARVLYGFRNSLMFALLSWLLTCVVAFVIGAFQAYLGGRVDLYGQRLIEIWNALPVLYVLIYLRSLFPVSLAFLLVIYVAFSWIALASYFRAEVLRIRKMDYVESARALGANTFRILFVHIFRNALTPMVTLSPFLIAAAVGALAALDYLGLGLAPPTASWGELLRQGKENLDSWWLAGFPFLALFTTLLLLNFVGEATRSALDARES